MVVEQTLFGTVFLSDGNRITVSPLLGKSKPEGCTIKIENNGYEQAFYLSKAGIGELVAILQSYTK